MQEETLSAAAEVLQVSAAPGISQGEVALEPSLSDVQLVEAFFELEGRLEAALAAASHPAAPPEGSIASLTQLCCSCSCIQCLATLKSHATTSRYLGAPQQSCLGTL